jgi:hypothetical protein
MMIERALLVVSFMIGLAFAIVVVGAFAIIAYHTQQYWYLGGWLILFLMVGLVFEVLCLGWVIILRIYRHGSNTLTEWDMPVRTLPPVRLPMLGDSTEPMYDESEDDGTPTSPGLSVVRNALDMASKSDNDDTSIDNSQIERAIEAVKNGATNRKKLMEALNLKSTYVADKLLKRAKKEARV